MRARSKASYARSYGVCKDKKKKYKNAPSMNEGKGDTLALRAVSLLHQAKYGVCEQQLALKA